MMKQISLLEFPLLGLLLSTLMSCQNMPSHKINATRQPSSGIERTAFVHLFEWKWNDIARECTEVLGPAGYAAVQISPPNEHRVMVEEGRPWYERYQPVSYKLESRSGNREEFAKMVSTCRAAGVDIYADVVINHMTGVMGKDENYQGSAGSKFGQYSYPGLYTYNNFHHCGVTQWNDIENYHDRFQVQNCELANLADLDTGSPQVQEKIATYLKDLLSLGVKGFRIDAAKHISKDDLKSILAPVMPNSPYVFQEVIDQGGDEPIKAKEYFENGDVTEFKYGGELSRVLRDGKLSWLKSENQFGEGWNFMPSHLAVVFVNNHDNQRNHGGGGNVLTYKNPDLYEMANILMLAWPYGYPSVMSSYAFTDGGQGPPSEVPGQTRSVFKTGCLPKENVSNASSGWVCEHRWPAIRAMVQFRNVTAKDFSVDNWWTNGNNQISFSRGKSGFFALNHEDQSLTRKFQTGLPKGTYCNVLVDKPQDPLACQAITVNDQGEANLVLPPQSAIALHIGRRTGD